MSPEAAGHRVELARNAGLPAWVLHDDAANLHATWVPAAGMLGASLVHHGEELLWTGAGVAGYARTRAFMGIPFLYPWANRLDGFSYRAGGEDIVLDPESPLLLLDENGLPIHGVLTASRRWAVRELVADAGGTRLVAALDFNRPELLAIFPFPHHVEMEVGLSDGALHVRTTVSATGEQPVPVAFGFHPYLRIPGVPRAQWEVSAPVRRRLLTDERLIPTGRTEPVVPLEGPIGERTWDDGYDRIDSPARFTVRGGGRTIELEFVEGYSVVQIFAPPGEEYVCVEPMTAPANSLAVADRFLQWVAPGDRRSATFRIACRLDV